MKLWHILVVAGLLVSVLGFWIYKSLSSLPICLKTEPKYVCTAAYTSVVIVGKVLMPIYHPATCAVRTVCVEYDKQ